MATALEVHENLDTQLDNPQLRYRAGLLKTVFEKGGRQFYADIPAVEYNGVTSDVVLELGEPTGSSVRGPYTRSVVKTNAKVARIPVPDKHLMRDVETPIKSQRLNSRFYKQRNLRLRRNAKRLGKDHITQAFLGSGQGENWWGLEYYLQGIAGLHSGDDGSVSFPNDSSDLTWPKRREQKLFGTDTGEINGSPEPLDPDHLNELHTLCGNEQFHQVACSKDAFLAIENILDSLPGNTAEYRRIEKYGMDVLVYKSIPYVRYDVLDRSKVSTRGQVSGDGTEVTIDAPEPDDVFERWIGATDKDIGADVEIRTGAYEVHDDGTVTGGEVDTFTLGDVTDWKTLVPESALGATFQSETECYIEIKPQPAMYGMWFDEDEGVHMLYGDSEEGEMGADPGDEYGPLIGLSHYPVGRAQTGGRWYIDQLDMCGNIVAAGVTCVARFTHFTIPTA